MNTVQTVNLNGAAYQVEERGVKELRSYLDQAALRLKGDPGKDEVLADLEQAIAEKCDLYLKGRKNVVTSDEVDRIILEMGPVEADTAEAASDTKENEPEPAKRLHRIPEEGWVSGVFSGMGAYFTIDPVILRLIFIIIAVVTNWFVCGLIYLLLASIIPPAKTYEQKAAARGEKFTAQEVMERARRGFAQAAQEGGKWWDKYSKQPDSPASREYWEHFYYRNGDIASTISRVVMVVVLCTLWVTASWSVVSTGSFFGLSIFEGEKLWIPLSVITGAFYLMFWPLGPAFSLARAAGSDPRRYVPAVVSQVLGWLVWIAVLGAVTYLVLRFGLHVSGSPLQSLQGHVHIGSHEIY